MTFWSSHQLLITNEVAHCVEECDLQTGLITAYVSACDGTSGHSYTGHRLHDVSIDVPMGIFYDGGHRVYISILISRNLISIDTTTDQSSVVLTSSDMPRILGYGLNSDTIYTTLSTGFGAIKDDSIERVVGSSGQFKGSTIGTIGTTRMDHPTSFLEVTDGTWVIADRYNNR